MGIYEHAPRRLKLSQQISANTCTVQYREIFCEFGLFGCGFSLVTLQATGQILTLPSNFQAKLSWVWRTQPAQPCCTCALQWQVEASSSLTSVVTAEADHQIPRGIPTDLCRHRSRPRHLLGARHCTCVQLARLAVPLTMSGGHVVLQCYCMMSSCHSRCCFFCCSFCQGCTLLSFVVRLPDSRLTRRLPAHW